PPDRERAGPRPPNPYPGSELPSVAVLPARPPAGGPRGPAADPRPQPTPGDGRTGYRHGGVPRCPMEVLHDREPANAGQTSGFGAESRRNRGFGGGNPQKPAGTGRKRLSRVNSPLRKAEGA